MHQSSVVKQGHKLGYAFSPVPKERHPSWYDLPIFTRMLGLELYVEQQTNGTDPPGILVSGDWPVSLCRTMRIDGPQRPAIVRSLLLLRARGLLVVEGGVARVLLSSREVLAGVLPGSCPGLARVLPLATPGNDSIHVLQIRSEETRSEREDARAQEASPISKRAETETPPAPSLPPSDPPAEWLFREPELASPHTPWRLGHDLALAAGLNPTPLDKRAEEWIGEQPEAERVAVLKQLKSDPWCLPNASVRHVVQHWKTYAQGQSPGRRAPERRSYGHDDNPLIDPSFLRALQTELTEVQASLRTCTDEGDRYALEMRENDLRLRVSRVQARVA